MTKNEQVQLSDKEMAEVQKVAKQYGISEDEAATQVFSAEVARRMKRRPRPPAKIRSIRRK